MNKKNGLKSYQKQFLVFMFYDAYVSTILLLNFANFKSDFKYTWVNSATFGLSADF